MMMNNDNEMKQEFCLAVLKNMSKWSIKNSPGNLAPNEAENLDNLSPEARAYVDTDYDPEHERWINGYLTQKATAKWCDEYYHTMFCEAALRMDERIQVPALKRDDRFPVTRYTREEILDYLWDNRKTILASGNDSTMADFTLAKAAIHFIHRSYLENYQPRDPRTQLLTRAKFIGLGDYNEAWIHLLNYFYATASPAVYLEWMESVLRDFAYPISSVRHKDALERVNQPLFRKEILDLLVDNRQDIVAASLEIRLFDTLFDLLMPVFNRYIGENILLEERFLILAEILGKPDIKATSPIVSLDADARIACLEEKVRELTQRLAVVEGMKGEDEAEEEAEKDVEEEEEEDDEDEDEEEEEEDEEKAEEQDKWLFNIMVNDRLAILRYLRFWNGMPDGTGPDEFVSMVWNKYFGLSERPRTLEARTQLLDQVVHELGNPVSTTVPLSTGFIETRKFYASLEKRFKRIETSEMWCSSVFIDVAWATFMDRQTAEMTEEDRTKLLNAAAIQIGKPRYIFE